MKFGFTLKPDHTIERTLALTRQAEAAGFEYAWLFDSHVLWQEAYVLLTLMATASERLRHLSATADEDVHLIPGASIGGGRYRLLVFHGGPPNLQFWQALDTALDRQVALTFVDPDATLPEAAGRFMSQEANL